MPIMVIVVALMIAMSNDCSRQHTTKQTEAHWEQMKSQREAQTKREESHHE